MNLFTPSNPQSSLPRMDPSARLGRCLLGLLGALALGGPARAELSVPSVIASGMVVQQQSSVPIWGKADPAQRVEVTASWGDGTKIEGTANAEGQWSVLLPTPSASKDAATVTIRTGDEVIELTDVLVGEVWLCSGQSNMEWEVSSSIAAARERGELAPEKTSLEPAHIRHYTVPRALATEPQSTGAGEWLDASGEDAMTCSAAAYFFAQRIQEDVDVPVGLIVSSWGGTPAESWVSPDVVAAFPNHAQTLADVREGASAEGVNSEKLDAFWQAADDKAFFARRFRDADFDDSHWDQTAVPTHFGALGLENFNGVVWFRTEVDVPPSWAGQDLELQLPPLDDIDETLWNGERVGSEISAGAWSVKRNYPIPASSVVSGRASLAIRILDTGGRGGFGAGDMRLVNGEEWIDLAGDWRYRQGVTAEQAGLPPRPPRLSAHTPSALYNAMISPLRPYGIRGVLWYQGESNRARAAEYRHLFPALIVNWRQLWDDLELPFYFVQIAPYNYNEGKAGAVAVAELREAQAIAARLPMTGMALTADIGNPRDIHPKNKWEVGRRLALFALRDVYGLDAIEPDGPTLREATLDGDDLVLHFDHVGGALKAGTNPMEHFELRSADGDFVPASATIGGDGQTIRLRVEGLKAPTGARYLWSDAAESSVSGGTGLPMAPFSTTVKPAR